jgi:L-threonylcarbamoyladenylate synthase
MRINLEETIAKLQAGEVVAIPTETVYGLAADARNENALRNIYATKERPATNPLIVHLADVNQVPLWASTFPPLAEKLAKAFWPGPFTLVLPAHDDVSNILRAGEPTVALRVPNHPMTLQVLQGSGLSLAAPSANKYTHLSPTTASHVEASLGKGIAVLDGGACAVGIESTIVSVHDDAWQILRHGVITEAQIEAVAGKKAMQKSDDGNMKLPKAPGQHHLHYAPHTPTYLFNDVTSLQNKLNGFLQTHQTGAVLAIGDAVLPSAPLTVHLNLTPNAVAEALYASLHRLDSLKVDSILVLLPPQTPEWAAIRDRLSRAGHSTKL